VDFSKVRKPFLKVLKMDMSIELPRPTDVVCYNDVKYLMSTRGYMYCPIFMPGAPLAVYILGDRNHYAITWENSG